jgi:LysM repeat protein
VAKTTDDAPASSNLTPPPDAAPSTAATSTETDATPPPPKPQKGYYHVVAFGETLKMIVDAYRDNGVKTSVAEVCKANGLTKDAQLKAGQKLFIPKPGT